MNNKYQIGDVVKISKRLTDSGHWETISPVNAKILELGELMLKAYPMGKRAPFFIRELALAYKKNRNITFYYFIFFAHYKFYAGRRFNWRSIFRL